MPRDGIAQPINMKHSPAVPVAAASHANPASNAIAQTAAAIMPDAKIKPAQRLKILLDTTPLFIQQKQ